MSDRSPRVAPYTLDELRRYLAANSYEFGGWGLDTARWYATVDAMTDRITELEAALRIADRALRKAWKALRGDEYAETAEGWIDSALSRISTVMKEKP